MRAFDNRSCEAGIEGGNSEHGRESRRAELDMDRYTNPLLNRRQSVTGSPVVYEPAQKGMDGESGGSNSPHDSTLAAIPAENGVLNPATNGSQERGNPIGALRVHALSR